MKSSIQTSTCLAGRLAGLGLLMAILSACGAQVTPRNSAALYSGGGPLGSAPIINESGDGMTECNSFDSTSIRLSGKVTTYYYNDVLKEDMIRLRLTGIPDVFSTKSTVYIQMFRWKMKRDPTTGLELEGQTELDSVNPVMFNVESGGGSVTPIASDKKDFYLSDVTALRKANSIPGTTALDFFSNTTFVLRGLDYSWSALKIVVYDGTTVVGQADLLLPAFQANPNRYASSHASLLEQMHPFWAQKNQSYTESDWSGRARSLCF